MKYGGNGNVWYDQNINGKGAIMRDKDGAGNRDPNRKVTIYLVKKFGFDPENN